jgi:hypothetical protein
VNNQRRSVVKRLYVELELDVKRNKTSATFCIEVNLPKDEMKSSGACLSATLRDKLTFSRSEMLLHGSAQLDPHHRFSRFMAEFTEE